MRYFSLRRGTASIEYGLIVMLVGIALIVAFQAMGGSLERLYALTSAVVTAL